MLHLAAVLLVLIALPASAMAQSSNGDTTAKKLGSKLKLSGDAEINEVDLTSVEDGLLVSPVGGSTLNGGGAAILFEGVKSLAIDDSSLTVILEGVSLAKGISARLKGESLLRLEGGCEIGGSVSVRLVDEGAVALDDSTVFGNLLVRAQGTRSFVSLGNGSFVSKNLRVRAGDGSHRLTIVGGGVGKSVALTVRDTVGSLVSNSGFALANAQVGKNLRLKARDQAAEESEFPVLFFSLLAGAEVGGSASFRSRDGGVMLRLESCEVLGKFSVKWRKEIEDSDVRVNDLGPGVAPPTRIHGDASFSAGEGTTFIEITDGSEFGGRLKFSLGDGLGIVTMGDSSVAGELRVKGGRDFEELTFVRSTFGKRARVDSRDGSTQVLFLECELPGGLDVRAGPGEDGVSLLGNLIGSGKGTSSILLGDGDNELDATATTVDSKLNITMGNGDDAVDLSDATVTGALKVKLGKGEDHYAAPAD